MRPPTTTHSPPESPPPRGLRVMVWAGVALVIVALAVGVLAVAGGVFDPPEAGPVVWSDDTLTWAGGLQIMLAPGAGSWQVAPQTLPEGTAFTLEVRARLSAASDPLAAWGVWVAQRDGTRTLYAINAGGYWTIRTCPPPADQPDSAVIEDCPAPDPAWRWSPYPRIHAPGSANTITLHCEARDCSSGGALRLRVNREKLGAPVVAAGGTWGVWTRGGADSAALEWLGASLAVDTPDE